MRFVQVTDHSRHDPQDKLRSVRQFYDHIRDRCKVLYQPQQEVSLDERMVNCKGHFSFRQFIPSKPIRFGYKLVVLTDSRNGYTMDFNVYLGKANRAPDNMSASEAVVMTLIKPYLRQGYRLYIDNYYTSLLLLTRLYEQGTRCVGTFRCNRGPPALQNGKSWAKRVDRGSMRCVRVEGTFVLQWKDKKPVIVASTLHRPTYSSLCTRNSRDQQGHHGADSGDQA